MGDAQGHHGVIVLPRQRLRPSPLVFGKGQHLFQGFFVLDQLQVVSGHLFQVGDQVRPCDGVGLPSVGLLQFPCVCVGHLSDVLVGVVQPIQLLHRVCGEVDLHADQGLVVGHPKAEQLPGVFVLVQPPSQSGHLLSGGVVQHLAHEVVRPFAAAVACRVPADDVWHTVHRLLKHHDLPVLGLFPGDGGDLLTVIFVHEPAPADDPLLHVLQPQNNGILVKDAGSRCHKGLLRAGRVLLPESVGVAAAVDLDAPPPPGQLLVRQAIGPGHGLLFFRPLEPRLRGLAVFVHLEPGGEEWTPAVPLSPCP